VLNYFFNYLLKHKSKMFCSTQFLLKRCYLLYAFIAIAILLLLFCIYLYKKYTKQNKLEDMEVDIANLQEDSRVMENFSEVPQKDESSEASEDEPITSESGEGDSELIRNPLQNDEENEKVKENDKEIVNGKIDLDIVEEPKKDE